MEERKRLLEQLAAYRDLSDEERRLLKEMLQKDSAAAERLAAYQEMDRQLMELPAATPDPDLRHQFYESIIDKRRPPDQHGLLSRLLGIPAAVGRTAVALVLILVLAVVAYSFREQLRLAAVPGANDQATDVSSAPGAEPIPSRPSGLFVGPTPTFAVDVDRRQPFQHFMEYVSRWPEQMGMAMGSVRAEMITYLQQNGGIEALEQGDGLAELEEMLRSHIPNWNADSLQVVDVIGDERPELIVAILPLVDVYTMDGAGVYHVRGLPMAQHWPRENTWPTSVVVEELNGQRSPEILVTYTYDGPEHLAQEVVLATWRPFDGGGNWEAGQRIVLRDVASAESPVILYNDAQPPLLQVACQIYGTFEAETVEHMENRTIYRWHDGDYVPIVYERSNAVSERHTINLAEAHLREGLLAEALAFYRLLYTGEATPAEETVVDAADGGPDWPAYAALRAGQLYALLGQREQSQEALSVAADAGSTIGRLAQRFGDALENSGDPAVAWAALLQDEQIFEESAEGTGNLVSAPGNPQGVLYAGMAAAAALDTEVASLEDAQTRWTEAGLDVRPLAEVDLDRDSHMEFVVALSTADGNWAAWQLDRGAEGWFAAEFGQLPNPDAVGGQPMPGPDESYEVLQVGNLYAGWDGQYAHFFQDTRQWLQSTQPQHLCPLRSDELVLTVDPAEIELDMRQETENGDGSGPVPASTPTPAPYDGAPPPMTPTSTPLPYTP